MKCMLATSIPPEVHLLRAEKAGTPEMLVPVYETSGHQQLSMSIKTLSRNVQTPLHISSRFSTYRISRKFQRFWSDTTATFSPRTHVTWCNQLWFKLFSTPYIKPIRRPRLRYSGRHLSNVSLSCTWKEKGEIYAPHQSRHCRKCIRSPTSQVTRGTHSRQRTRWYKQEEQEKEGRFRTLRDHQ